MEREGQRGWMFALSHSEKSKWGRVDDFYSDILSGLKGQSEGVIRTMVWGDVLQKGAVLEAGSTAPVPEVSASFDGGRVGEVYPLAGFGLPYEDSSVEECRVLPPVLRLSERYREAIIREARRVSDKLILEHCQA